MTAKEYLQRDHHKYPSLFSLQYWKESWVKSEQYYIRSYVRYLRLEEYYTFIKTNKILKLYYQRKRNILGSRLGFFINPGNFDAGLRIEHIGSIIVHPKAKIGNNCVIHGNCCIGSNGIKGEIAPIIGDGVDIGQGAQVIGNITIANYVKIGAGAVVVKSVLQEGGTVVGVPAKLL